MGGILSGSESGTVEGCKTDAFPRHAAYVLVFGETKRNKQKRLSKLRSMCR